MEIFAGQLVVTAAHFRALLTELLDAFFEVHLRMVFEVALFTQFLFDRLVGECHDLFLRDADLARHALFKFLPKVFGGFHEDTTDLLGAADIIEKRPDGTVIHLRILMIGVAIGHRLHELVLEMMHAEDVIVGDGELLLPPKPRFQHVEPVLFEPIDGLRADGIQKPPEDRKLHTDIDHGQAAFHDAPVACPADIGSPENEADGCRDGIWFVEIGMIDEIFGRCCVCLCHEIGSLQQKQ